jgi:hypothetical protein
MGGYVIFEFLRRWRDRVRAVILVDTQAEADGTEARRTRDVVAATARESGAGAIADAMLPKLLAPGTVEESPAAEHIRRMMAATPIAGIVGALAAMRDRRDSTGLLPPLAGLPALVIVGEEDVITPPDGARRIAAAIPGARLVIVPGAGHLTPVERPSETTAAIRDSSPGRLKPFALAAFCNQRRDALPMRPRGSPTTSAPGSRPGNTIPGPLSFGWDRDAGHSGRSDSRKDGQDEGREGGPEHRDPPSLIRPSDRPSVCPPTASAAPAGCRC